MNLNSTIMNTINCTNSNGEITIPVDKLRKGENFIDINGHPVFESVQIVDDKYFPSSIPIQLKTIHFEKKIPLSLDIAKLSTHRELTEIRVKILKNVIHFNFVIDDDILSLKFK